MLSTVKYEIKIAKFNKYVSRFYPRKKMASELEQEEEEIL